MYLNHILAIFIFVLLPVFLQAQTPEGFTWQDVHNVDFGEGSNHFMIEAASSGLGGEVELRLDSTNGPVIGRTFFHYTGSADYFFDYECDLSSIVSGTHDLYMNFQDYTEPDSGGILNIGDFEFSLVEEPAISSENRLHVYPPVPGLASSPYFDIYIQKVSDLNAAELSEVTNWETPFAWFTQCPDYVPGGNSMGYYSNYIGGWSNTYINFELDPNTPIVVKIVRENDTGDGAPGGPVEKAVVRPAKNVDSWEIIDGDIYVIMSQPALVAVDIDGQMETRVSPRATPTGWNPEAFPFRTRKEGAHSVTIFANPFIEDKPNPDDPGVLVVKAGEKIPDNLDDLDWDILYFEPGIHKTSVYVDSLGNLIERRWEPDDPITLQDDKSYYIPGDAIVYGNFTDINRSNDKSENIRIFGHGTISGSKIDWYKSFPEFPDGYTDAWWTRALYLRNAKNCHFEGITAADPAFHTLCLISSVKESYEPNTIKWCKVIGWRTNTDGSAVAGNVEMEDCFIRCQDDGHYIGGTTRMRRVVFWHDVNGQTFRGSFTTRRYSEDNALNIPKQIIYEDIDVIYVRGVFSTSDNGFGLIGVRGGSDNEVLSGGVENTGQMVYFRDITISDPLPTRNIFSFDAEDKMGDYAGIRFENIDYQGEQVFGWRNKIVGSTDCNIRNFVFDNVSINAEKIDQKYVDDHFITDHHYNATFRNDHHISSGDYTLSTTATNGRISITETGAPGEVSLNAIPTDGYRFRSWSGDLNGSDVTDTLVLDRDKAITANFELITYSITTSAENGTIRLDPQSETYLPGTEVTVRAVGDLGYGLESWGGDLSGNENPVTIIMNSDQSISAIFKEIETCKLTIETNYGTVLLDPPGGEYNPGTIVTLTPEEDPGYYFEQWFGDIEGSDDPASVTMDTNKIVIARFVYAGWGSTASAINFGGADYLANDGTTYSGNNSGATYSTGSSISGTEDDQLYRTERFGNNFSLNIPVINGSYQVTLMFAEIFHDAAGDRLFNVSIEGAEVISNLDIYSKVGKNAVYNETHEVTITDGEINIDFTTIVDNAKISAIKVVSNLFEGETYTLTTDDPDNGTIIANPADGSYPAGSNVSMTALPDSGFIFTGWSGDLTSTENPATLYMNGDKDLSAIFTETNWYTLTASATNGIISIDPGEGIYGYTEGTVVSLTAIPDEGYYFTGWSGDLSGMVNPATIVMDSDKEIAAEFLNPYALTISINSNNGSVQVMPEQEVYYRGASVFLMAIPDEGYEFVRWEGDLTGSDNPAGFVINRNLIITAVFNEVTGTRDVISDHSAKTILLQNYPNPFSNETTIQYELNKATHVKLTIYHVLGYHLATLVDEYQAAGSHSVTWHAKENKGEHLTNGFYIYRLETGSEVIHIKKASLMR